jgi:D-alanyl-D-alanine carboxypeptidase (penicillin-binding protein 5/6)
MCFYEASTMGARKRRRKRHRALVSALVCAALAFAVGIALARLPGIPPESPPSTAISAELAPTPRALPASSQEPTEEAFDASGLKLNSSNAILISLGSGQTLYEKSATERVYPASLTKIMTAVVVLDNITDFRTTVTLDQRIFDETTVQNASVAGFLPDESVGVEDLLYGLILSSGAECAIGLAEYIAGTEAAFADMMNRKAAELGMTDTHFVNAAGIHDPKHYSTTHDIAALLDSALGNETFVKVFTAHRHSADATNKHPDGMTLNSTLFSKTSGEYGGFKLLGGKTGYTSEAGQCLASLAEADGKQYILVTCGAPGDNHSQTLHIDDAVAVYAAMQGMEQIDYDDNPPGQSNRPGSLPPLAETGDRERSPRGNN